MKLFVRLANCNPVRVVEVNLSPMSSIAMLKQRIEALTGVNEYKQKIYCAGQFMEPDLLLSSFELAEGTELKLLVKMSKITNKVTPEGIKPAAALPPGAPMGIMGLQENEDISSSSGSDDGSDGFNPAEEEAILHAAMNRITDSHKRQRGEPKK